MKNCASSWLFTKIADYFVWLQHQVLYIQKNVVAGDVNLLQQHCCTTVNISIFMRCS